MSVQWMQKALEHGFEYPQEFQKSVLHRNIFLDLFFDDIAINVYEYIFRFFSGAFDIDGICS